MKFDLHVHTSFSDGKFSPKEVVNKSVEKGLNGIGITDHDTVSGIDSAIEESKKYKDFSIIPGIEFSSIYLDEEVHILGYFIDYNDDELLKATEILINSRQDRAEKIISKLNEVGISINMKDVLEHSGKNIGRLHIAEALVKKRVVGHTQEAFELYLGRGKPAYVERYKLSTKDAIKLIHDTGGIAVLAHPGLLKNKDVIEYTISSGINGIECVHSKHNSNDIKRFKKLAKDNNLLITGGSDFHGVPDILGNYYVDFESVSAMEEKRG